MKTITMIKYQLTALLAVMLVTISLAFSVCVLSAPRKVAMSFEYGTSESAAATVSYTTTDRLYFQLPAIQKSFTTLGGYVNTDWHLDTISKITDTFSNVLNWLEVYIMDANGNKWTVPKSDAVNGRYYYKDEYGTFGAYKVYFKVNSEMPSNKLYTYLCNKDQLWDMQTFNYGKPFLTHNDDTENCTFPLVQIYNRFFNVYGDRTFTDSRKLNAGEVYNDGAGQRVKNHNTQENVVGLNPTLGDIYLATVSFSAEHTLSASLWIGAYTAWSSLQAGPAQIAHRAPSTNVYFSITLPSGGTSTTAPTLSTNQVYSNTAVAATWTHSRYTYATYTLNGTDKGEYTQSASLKDEGKYVITAKDSLGNNSSIELFVDKTAPKFADSFYSNGERVTVKSKTNASATWKSATANESPISSCTYTRKYYDTASKSYKTDAAKNYTANSALTVEGLYTFTLTDIAGNKETATVILDKTNPLITTSATYSRSSITAKTSFNEVETAITMTYSYNGGASQSCKLSTSFTSEGKYVITATDEAKNSTSVTVYVDKTAPKFADIFYSGSSRVTAKSKTSASATWKSATANESPIASCTYAREYYDTASNSYKKDTAKSYAANTALTVEGLYTFTLTDKAGNTETATYILDKTNPLITTSAIYSRSSITARTSYNNVETAVTMTYSFNGGASQSCNSLSPQFTSEGKYVITATDEVSNSSTVTVYVDKTAPSIEFSSSGKVFERYTSSAFTAKGSDGLSGVKSVELYSSGKYVPYDNAPISANNAYTFRVTDNAGNTFSAVATVYKTDTYGNKASIYNSYKVNEWYLVTLPARIFTTDKQDIAGKYSFSDYQSALSYAFAKEKEFRVTAVQGGYMYVSATNESVTQKYDSIDTVNSIVEKYAKGYISSRITANGTGNHNYYTEHVSLTRNAPTIPPFVAAYGDLNVYFANPSYMWSLPKISYLSSMPYRVSATYLGDIVKAEPTEYTVKDSTTLIASLGNDYKQGYYLITETDEAGNIEKYVIYSDSEPPKLEVTALKGNGSEQFVLDYDYAKNDTLHFLSLTLESLKDNLDGYLTVRLEKNSDVYYFTQADSLPVLGSEQFTSGKYTITVYDRTLNTLSFDVFIAANAPTMTHTSLAADKTECKIIFSTSDRYNVITGISLYKIEYDGKITAITKDSQGTIVSIANLTYVLNEGGKYGATVTDNYMRTIEFDAIFFLKGLPSGSITGVKDGGRTNKNVAFTFDNTAVAVLYSVKDGKRVEFTDYTTQKGYSQTTYYVTASETTSLEYYVFLYNAEDISLFVEYTFEIDTVLPEFTITDNTGVEIAVDGATNKPFSISWKETGVSMRYYTARSGLLSETGYSMNTVLKSGTLYYFTVKDAIGNSLKFTVLLDNFVDYTLSANVNQVNEIMYTNKPIALTVNEPTQEFKVVNADGYTISNGGTITVQGRYEISITDNYRNSVSLIIVLDTTAPTLTLDGTSDGNATKNAVKIHAKDYNSLYLADKAGNKLKDLESGTVFDTAGTYYISATDFAGNKSTVSFSIDLTVDYALSVPDGAVTTSKVTVTSNEVLTITATLNGEAIDTAKTFAEYGTYALTLTDELGNTVSCVFSIIPKYSQTQTVVVPQGVNVLSVTLNGKAYPFEGNSLYFTESGEYTVTMDCYGTEHILTFFTDSLPPQVALEKSKSAVKIASCDKDNVTLVLMFDGEQINCRIGQTFTQNGKYVLTVTDELGNMTIYEWTIPYRLNTWAVVVIVIGFALFVVVLVLIIRSRRKPRLK